MKTILCTFLFILSSILLHPSVAEEAHPEDMEIIRCTSVVLPGHTVLCEHSNGTSVTQCMNCFSDEPRDCYGYQCGEDPEWTCYWPEGERKWICEGQEASIQEDPSLACPSVSIRGEYLDLKFNGIKSWVEIEKSPWREKLELNSTTYISIPERALMTTGEIQVTVICGREMIYATFPIMGRVVCPISDCLFCKDTVNYFQCTTQSHKALMIIVGLILALVLVMFILCMVFLVIRIRNRCKRPVLLVSLVMLIGGAMACDDVFAFSVDGSKIVNGTLIEQTDVIVKFTEVGSTSCLNLRSGNDTFGNISIKLKEHVLQFQSDFQYYTSDWTARTDVRHRCAGTKGCKGGDDKCDFTGACARVNNECQLRGSINDLPGDTRCQTSCRCAGCSNCISCGDSCLYSRFAVDHHGNDYKVQRAFQSRSLMNFDLDVSLEHIDHMESFDLTLGSSLVMESLGVKALGSNIDGGVFLADDCFISGQSRDWLLPCSPRNAPIGGALGDLQYSGSVVAYPWSEVHHTRRGDDMVEFYYPAKGARLLTTSRELPLTRGSCLMRVRGGQLVCSWQGSVEDEVVITLPPGLKVLRKFTPCKVTGEVKEQRGCSSCFEGFNIIFKLTADCPTSVRFESNDWVIFNQFHDLLPGSQDVTLRLFTGEVNSKGKITMISDVSTDFSLDIFAPELNHTIENDLNRIIGISPSGSDVVGGDFLGGLFGNLPLWSKILIILGLAIGGVVTLLLLVKYGPRVVSWALKRKAYGEIQGEEAFSGDNSQSVELEDFHPEELTFDDF